MAFRIESPSFENGGTIPRRFTCDGEDASPPLRWMDPPPGTKSFALICDDPDAPMITWVHWIVYAIPSNVTELREGVPKSELLEGGMKQGRNSWRKTGYGGPCPPGRKPHRYVFRLYALDTELALAPGEAKKDLERAMAGHILAQVEIMGRYGRQ